VTESLVKFYTSYKGQDADVTRTSEKLESLLGTFHFLSSGIRIPWISPNSRSLATQLKVRYLRRMLPLLEYVMVGDQRLGLVLTSSDASGRDR
jgi:hypothetical protein